MIGRPGKIALFEQLAADGIQYMFGNPGTVEQGFLDAGAGTGTEYILALHEGVAVAMADGYARAAQRPGLVQLHTGVGLGNGVGLLYQAKRGGSPLVVIAGDAGVRYDAMDGQMAAGLVDMARPVTKFAARVTHPSSVLRMLQRAVKIAMTPPRGPVFVALPADVLDEITTEPAAPSTMPVTRTVPEQAVVARAARALLAGERRLILMGDGIAASGAQKSLTRVAEHLNAPVWGLNSSEVNFDTTHHLWGGHTGHMFGADSARVVGDADSVLIVGTYVFPEVFPFLESPFKPGARIVHIDLDAYEIAKNFPADIGVVADPKLALEAIGDELGRMRPVGWPGRVRYPAGAGPFPVSPGDPHEVPDTVLDRFVHHLSQRAPQNIIVFDEALTASAPLARYLPARVPGRFFQTRGGSLGVGIPGALGVKLARPEAPVVGFTGDGGSMYTIQALWTAARYGIASKIVICNNRRYRLLDVNIEQYWSERGIGSHEHPAAFDLSGPDIDFSGLAQALGVAAQRVDRGSDLGEAVNRMLAHDGPYLIDLVID